jgi:hypothetical protein
MARHCGCVALGAVLGVALMVVASLIAIELSDGRTAVII